MELKDDEFKALRSRVEKVSAELEKKDAARAVNTKWMATVGAIIVAALGYTNFVQLPAEAAKAAKEQVGPEIVEEANKIVGDLRAYNEETEGIVEVLRESTKYVVPKGTIVAWNPEKEKWQGEITEIKAPDGWAICDGENGTPDLRDRFIRGTLQYDSLCKPGGDEKHTHAASCALVPRKFSGGGQARNVKGGQDHAVTYIEHIHGITITPGENLPPFVSLVFIMKLQVGEN